MRSGRSARNRRLSLCLVAALAAGAISVRHTSSEDSVTLTPLGGRPQAVALDRGRVYLGVGPSVLIVDVTEPAAPREVEVVRVRGTRE